MFGTVCCSLPRCGLVFHKLKGACRVCLLSDKRTFAVIESLKPEAKRRMSSTDPDSKPDGLSAEEAGLVRDHLKEVMASRAFAGSKRAQDFLQLIVEHALAGRYDSLRERTIGAEMFGRPIDYDTSNDAVVRVKATEVRRKLAQYYQESGKEPWWQPREGASCARQGAILPRPAFWPARRTCVGRAKRVTRVQGLRRW